MYNIVCMLLFSHEANSDLLFEIRMAAAVPPPTDSKAALKYAFSANFELGWRRQCRRRQIAKGMPCRRRQTTGSQKACQL